jgi:hypothetical protein
MASMQFDKETVFKMQCLIDEKKTELTEGDYIRMCNATKVVHGLAQTKESRKPIQIRMVINAFWRNGPEVPAYNNLNFTPSPDNIEIMELEAHKDRLIKELEELKKSKKYRIINDDKYTALIDYCSKHNVNYQIHPKFDTMSKKIAVLQDRVQNTVTVNLNKIYRAQMLARVAYIKTKNIELIEDCKTDIDKITRRLIQIRSDS